MEVVLLRGSIAGSPAAECSWPALDLLARGLIFGFVARGDITYGVSMTLQQAVGAPRKVKQSKDHSRCICRVTTRREALSFEDR